MLLDGGRDDARVDAEADDEAAAVEQQTATTQSVAMSTANAAEQSSTLANSVQSLTSVRATMRGEGTRYVGMS